MRTRRGLSMALGLAFVGVAPLVAQQPQHREGHDHPISHQEGSGMPMDHGPCSMIAATGMTEARLASPTGEATAAPQRVRRASGPSRLRAVVSSRNVERPTGDAVHAYRNRVRLTTGPSRFPPAIVGWHTLSASDEGVKPARRSMRRATGPSRFPRG
jgi:hypothetical protein